MSQNPRGPTRLPGRLRPFFVRPISRRRTVCVATCWRSPVIRALDARRRAVIKSFVIAEQQNYGRHRKSVGRFVKRALGLRRSGSAATATGPRRRNSRFECGTTAGREPCCDSVWSNGGRLFRRRIKRRGALALDARNATGFLSSVQVRFINAAMQRFDGIQFQPTQSTPILRPLSAGHAAFFRRTGPVRTRSRRSRMDCAIGMAAVNAGGLRH